jgi:hypothetical protein
LALTVPQAEMSAPGDTEEQARQLQAALTERLGFLGLELHPAKTKIVYCQDADRRGEAEHTSFDFLGYTFRGRLVRGRRGFFVSFVPAMSTTAKKAKGRQIRAWHLNRRSGSDLSGLAQGINPQVRGWINYYGAFYRNAAKLGNGPRRCGSSADRSGVGFGRLLV